MKIVRARKMGVLAASLTIAVAGLAACGGSVSGDAAPVSVFRTIQSVPDSVTEVGIQAAQYLGTYDECLPDSRVDHKFGGAVAQSIAAGSVDIGVVASTTAVAAIAGGLDAKIIGSSMDGWGQVLITGPDSKASSFDDLTPLYKFGITRFGSAGHYGALKLVQELGWDKGDYKFVPVGTFPSLQAGLKSDLFDGFMWGPDTGQSMQEGGEGKVVGGVRDLIGPISQIFFLASNKMIKDHPDDLKKFMGCTFQAVKKLKDERDVAIRFFTDGAKKNPDVVEGLVDRDLKHASSDGKMTDEQFAGVLDAVHVTIPEQKDLTLDKLKDMYVYWGDL